MWIARRLLQCVLSNHSPILLWRTDMAQAGETSFFKSLRKGVRDTVLQVPEIERKVKQATK